jgi:hypothetical protein
MGTLRNERVEGARGVISLLTCGEMGVAVSTSRSEIDSGDVTRKGS